MDPKAFERLEAQLHAAAQAFEYPPTPSVSRLVRPGGARPATVARLRRAGALALIVLALLATLSIPQVRAAVTEFLQIGVVRIWQAAPPTDIPVPTPAPTALPQTLPSETSPGDGPPTAPTPEDLRSLERVAGETTLEAAGQAVDFPIRLPTYPDDVGEPDHVYLQEMRGALLILAWTEEKLPEQTRMALHIIEPGSWALEKVQPRRLAETTVDGRPAVWAVGPYLLILRNGNNDIGRLVAGNVLIWEQDGLTYRLESGLSMEEAVKVAESIR